MMSERKGGARPQVARGMRVDIASRSPVGFISSRCKITVNIDVMKLEILFK